MNVFDFCDLCTDDEAPVRIYDMNPVIETVVFSGTMRDTIYMPWAGYEVLSFDLDPEDGLTLNIDTSES